MHVANSCYIPCSKAKRLGSLEHAKLVEAVAQISIEQTTLNIPIVNSVYLAESTIALPDEIPSESGINSDLEDDDVPYYMQNNYCEPYTENDISWWEYTDESEESHILNDHICPGDHKNNQNYEQRDDSIIPPPEEFSDSTEPVEEIIDANCNFPQITHETALKILRITRKIINRKVTSMIIKT